MLISFALMKSPTWLKTYVEGLDIVPQTRYRSDCPVCNKKNTFSVTDTGLHRMWFCFHADCNVSGRTGVTLSRTAGQTAFRTVRDTPAPVSDKVFEIPDTFVSLSRRVEAESYLRRVGAYDAYLSGAADIRYDVRMNRVVFLIKDGKRVVDAAGRSLDGRGPKWYRYGSSGSPFICGENRSVALVVEDCVSACAAHNIYTTAIALLGTNLLTKHVDILKQYERVFVALDKDATDKAISMVRKLHSHVPTRLMVLHTDLKNMEKDERDDFIRSYIDR